MELNMVKPIHSIVFSSVYKKVLPTKHIVFTYNELESELIIRLNMINQGRVIPLFFSEEILKDYNIQYKIIEGSNDYTLKKDNDHSYSLYNQYSNPIENFYELSNKHRYNILKNIYTNIKGEFHILIPILQVVFANWDEWN